MPPPLLYHYTDAAGLLGIVSTGRLWATDVECLNDAQEIWYAHDAVCEAMDQRASDLEAASSPDDGRIASRVALIRSAIHELGGRERPWAPRVCVACYCERPDLLSQWRAYGTNGGYAIGFDTDALQATTAQDPNAMAPYDYVPPVELKQVVYGLKAAAPIIAAMVEALAPEPVGHPGAKGAVAAAMTVLPALATIKHETFAEEQEWRLVIPGGGDEFRATNFGIVPYVRLLLPENAIKEVVVGPGHYPDLRASGVGQLLLHHELRDVKLISSVSPLRV